MTERKQGAGLKRFRSRQDLGTPPEFLDAIRRRFGHIAWDLAANLQNRVVTDFLGPGSPTVIDALKFPIDELPGLLWCNPPFELIPEFAAKMAQECRHRDAWALLLTPASSDANWAKVCEENGFVIVLEDRITFVGESNPYPKGLMLTAFGFNIVGRGRWHWDLSKTKAYERLATPKRPRKSKTDKEPSI